MSAIASIDQYAEFSPSERREQNKKWRLEIAKADTLPHKLNRKRGCAEAEADV